MSLLIGSRRALLGGKRRYYKKILSYGPIAYWPQWEPTGAVAQCLVNPAQNGAYIGVTLGQPGIGDGRTCPYYDALNDYTDVLNAAFIGAFDGGELTIAGWAKVNAVGVWTDGAARNAVHFYIGGNNRIHIVKSDVNNTLRWYYRAGGAPEERLKAGLTETGWIHLGLTASATADQVRAYYGGVQEGATMGTLGVWSGLPLTRAIIGADNVGPGGVWHGWLAHWAIWGRALPPATMADLAVL